MGISPVITIDNNNIIQVDKTKFLGVIINKTLTWTDHIHVIKSKVSKNLGLISYIKKNDPLSVLKHYIVIQFNYTLNTVILCGQSIDLLP